MGHSFLLRSSNEFFFKYPGNDTGVYFAQMHTEECIRFKMFTRLRAYIGFLPVRRTLPNSTHYALATLQHAGAVGPLITQNVDGLHHAALRRISPEPEVDRRILELHGSIFVSPSFLFPPLPSFRVVTPRGAARHTKYHTLSF
jgi:NAD-dependent SIR2 family protein deacetylase